MLLVAAIAGVGGAAALAASASGAVTVSEPKAGATVVGVVPVNVSIPPGDGVRETRILAGRTQIVRALSYRSGVGVNALVNTMQLRNGKVTLAVVTSRRTGKPRIARRPLLVANPLAASTPASPDRPRLTATGPRYKFSIPAAVIGGTPVAIRFTGREGNTADKVEILLDDKLVSRAFFRPGALGTLTTYVPASRLKAGKHLLRARVREAGKVRKFRANFTVSQATGARPITLPANPGTIPVVTTPAPTGTTTPRPNRPRTNPPTGGGTPTTPTTPTPPSPSPPSVPPGTPLPGTFMWAGDYETGNVLQYRDKAGRTDADGQRQAQALDRIQVVRSPVAQGAYAARFEVRQGDQIAGGNRAEMWHGNSLETEGDERWYQWYTMFDPSFPKSQYWQIFTQWHAAKPGTGPPVRFEATNDQIVFSTYGGSGIERHFTTPLVRGQWLHFRLHVKWSANKNVGFVELYYNGKLVVSRTPAATMLSGLTNYIKQGLYRSPKMTGTSVVYHDGLQMSRVN